MVKCRKCGEGLDFIPDGFFFQVRCRACREDLFQFNLLTTEEIDRVLDGLAERGMEAPARQA